MIKILCVAGAGPNFMKVAPLLRAFSPRGRFDVRLVHTGQHYDPDAILRGFHRVMQGQVEGRTPRFWDGRAAERIADHLESVLA